MRIHLKIQSKGITIPYDHQHLLTEAVHRWMGIQPGSTQQPAMFCFSNLKIQDYSSKGLHLGENTSFFIASPNNELLYQLIMGIESNPEVFFSLRVKEVYLESPPDLENRDIFFPASPILIKQYSKETRKSRFISYEDPQAGELLKKALQKKMSVFGLDLPDDFSIRFVPHVGKASTRLINYKGVFNRANLCPVEIQGSRELKTFAWLAGLGHSTGIGFGAIK
ncbi:CRISPR-associated endoribonuclease Cas6 [Thermonema lapsum]|uniref:CRISPR-associated endoribonuclease Cas6 n=1 Tax=Thermonema lapsum TaxID=28195 RepID=A0A846MRA9_9BACT|nr:CRISPR-associated endoribonuclease Cas6 [Thermonema lapsum]NIK73902.1 CRISPR-associated endoribonuclease Cas6 [Thermonema lapsum]